MAILRPIPPEALKRALEAAGYKVVDEGQRNWVLARDKDPVPVIIPKDGDLVSVDIMQDAYHKAPQEVFDAVKGHQPTPDPQQQP